MIECRTTGSAALATGSAGGAGTAPALYGARLNSVNPGIPIAATPPGTYPDAASFAPDLVTGHQFGPVESLVHGKRDAGHENTAGADSFPRRVGPQV